MMPFNVVVFFSGGKDSTLATFWALSSGFNVRLVSFIPKQRFSYMLQRTNVEITELISKAIGVKHSIHKISGEKEREIDEMLTITKSIKERENINGIVSGAIESEYQKQRVDYIGDKLGIPTFSPLWHKDADTLIEDVKNFNTIITKVAAEGLSKDDLGKPFIEVVSEKKKGIHPFLEGGEGETTVIDAPFFKYKIDIKEYEKRWYNTWGELIVKKAKLKMKHGETNGFMQ